MKTKDKLLKFKRLNGIVTEAPCTEEETAQIKARIASNYALPEGVYFKQTAKGGYFYRLNEENATLTEEQTVEFMSFLQICKLNAIKNWLIAIAAFIFVSGFLTLGYLFGFFGF